MLSLEVAACAPDLEHIAADAAGTESGGCWGSDAVEEHVVELASGLGRQDAFCAQRWSDAVEGDVVELASGLGRQDAYCTQHTLVVRWAADKICAVLVRNMEHQGISD